MLSRTHIQTLMRAHALVHKRMNQIQPYSHSRSWACELMSIVRSNQFVFFVVCRTEGSGRPSKVGRTLSDSGTYTQLFRNRCGRWINVQRVQKETKRFLFNSFLHFSREIDNFLFEFCAFLWDVSLFVCFFLCLFLFLAHTHTLSLSHSLFSSSYSTCIIVLDRMHHALLPNYTNNYRN